MTLSKVIRDLQQSGIKRSRLESPGVDFSLYCLLYCSFLFLVAWLCEGLGYHPTNIGENEAVGFQECDQHHLFFSQKPIGVWHIWHIYYLYLHTNLPNP